MLSIDEAGNRVIVQRPDGSQHEHAIDTPEAFEAVSAAWLRCGWDVKYVYGFTWLGRPLIQLPEDMMRIQEVIWRVRPHVVVETGVAHGGSLVFYASLFAANFVQEEPAFPFNEGTVRSRVTYWPRGFLRRLA